MGSPLALMKQSAFFGLFHVPAAYEAACLRLFNTFTNSPTRLQSIGTVIAANTSYGAGTRVHTSLAINLSLSLSYFAAMSITM